MKLKIPPPLVTFIFAGMLYILANFLPVGEFDFFGRTLLMYVLLGIGCILMLSALLQFFRNRTTTDPLHPNKASFLVIKGVFKYTRNPMYLAMLLFLIAIALKLGNAFNTLILAGFVYYMNHFQIRYEEEALYKRFEKEYKLYTKATRRWF